MITKRQITDKVFSIESDSWIQVQLAFCRLQEFYEGESTQKVSVKRIEELMEQYAEDSDQGTYSWFTDWAGFNVPGTIVRKFFKKASNLSKNERELKKLLTPLLKGREEFYIIGVKKGDMAAYEHEIAHGLYLTDKRYKREVKRFVSKLPKDLKKKMIKGLIDLGYKSTDREILMDEVHAFGGTGSFWELNGHLSLTAKEFSKLLDMQLFVMKQVSPLMKKAKLY
jgi:predicted nucleic-acid-binding Zn-ribbon protein